MKPTRIVIHNTANDATAENEIKYMHKNSKEISFHFAVDDKEAVQGIELNRNAWHAGDGNGKGNREGIGIEICYSRSGGKKWLKALENAAELTAKLLSDYGWGIERVTKHKDYSGKHCPHRILDEYGWGNFLFLVKSKMKELPANKIDVIYKVWDNIKEEWLPDVKNDEDYAGIFGHDISGVLANLSKGNITYRVHIKGGKWLPEVENRADYAGILHRSIDGIMIKTDTGKTVNYAVHLRKGKRWLPFVNGYETSDHINGYAGIMGQEIDGIKIYLD